MTSSKEQLVPVTTGETVKWLEEACRNWDNMPRLSDHDVQDVCAQLNAIIHHRLADLRTHPAVEPDEGLVERDIMIGEFIAQWDDAADGVTMDADTAQDLAREFKRMRGLIYCPGVLQCAKCGFRLTKTLLTPTGAFADDKPDYCPNCNVPLWKTTWKDDAADAYKTAESQMDRSMEAEKALATLTPSIQAKALEDDLEPIGYISWQAGLKLDVTDPEAITPLDITDADREAGFASTPIYVKRSALKGEQGV